LAQLLPLVLSTNVEEAVMQTDKSVEEQTLDPAARDFYWAAVAALDAAAVPVLVGGAFAFGHYTGITRHTKDFDLFIHPRDCRRALDVLAAAGYQTELTSPTWIGKAFSGEHFVDLIFGGGNGIANVDDEWFSHAPAGAILGRPVKLCPVEEMIWSKAFVMDRYRYDGADIAHLLRARGARLDWARLLRRFDSRWPVLLSHLILFRFTYPTEYAQIPDPVLAQLLDRARDAPPRTPPAAPVCQGTLFSRTQYMPDVEEWGYQDGRVQPWGNLSAEDAAQLTEAAKATEK
jgi:hypothetical protein